MISIDSGKPVDGGYRSTYKGPWAIVNRLHLRGEWGESNALQTFGPKRQLNACHVGVAGNPTGGRLLCRQLGGDVEKVVDGGRQHRVYGSRCSSSTAVAWC